jgi:DNA-binding response OmpR family regulator
MRAKQLILIVEDETNFRNLIHSFLHADYDVLLAADGQEAMSCYELHEESIAAVITDVRMPRVDGRELIEWLSRRRRQPPIIVMSGCSAKMGTEHTSLHGVVWLKKPFEVMQLVMTLKRLLETPETSAGSPDRLHPGR